MLFSTELSILCLVSFQFMSVFLPVKLEENVGSVWVDFTVLNLKSHINLAPYRNTRSAETEEWILTAKLVEGGQEDCRGWLCHQGKPIPDLWGNYEEQCQVQCDF